MTKWFAQTCSAIAIVTMMLSAATVLAQTPATQTDMGEHKQKMAEKMAEKMAKMTTADQKIADLVATMNAATGEERIAAMTAVINELMAQRKQMHESCGMMKKAPTAATEAADPDHGAHHPEK